ncbi:MAG: hypothetical protein ACP6IY_22470 [Promethearchaeia archaeon]
MTEKEYEEKKEKIIEEHNLKLEKYLKDEFYKNMDLIPVFSYEEFESDENIKKMQKEYRKKMNKLKDEYENS